MKTIKLIRFSCIGERKSDLFKIVEAEVLDLNNKYIRFQIEDRVYQYNFEREKDDKYTDE